MADCPRCRQVGSDALALVSTGVSAMCWYCSGVPCLHTSLQSLLHSTQTATKGMTVLKVMKKEMYIYAVTFKHIQTCTYTGHSLVLDMEKSIFRTKRTYADNYNPVMLQNVMDQSFAKY